MVNVGIDLHKTQFTVCVRGEDVEFDIGRMIDRKPAKKADATGDSTGQVREAPVEKPVKLVAVQNETESVKKPGVARKKIKKVG